ncbi:EpsG family protein [Myroides odoratimimus]|uniref:EpsG family protein n=1 Tax=Myroides odoratimimus TaxID=76832 RepID=UPI002578E9E1|nr:EpsG family protein [Myroides odoratimimus]MDM1094749.1 EpsG family protein [Myroides odoratimimus]
MRLNPNINKLVSNIVVVVVGFFLCMGYMTGSDWVNYEIVYEDPSLHIFYEPAYVLLMNIGYFFKLEFFPFLILIKFFCYFILVKNIKKYCVDSFLLAFPLFVSFFGLYLFIDNPLRNLIAIVIFVNALPYFLQKRYKLYFFYFFIALSFHKSAALAFFFPFLLLLPFQKLKKVLFTSLVVFVGLGVTGMFTKLFTLIISFIPFFNKFSESYLEEGSDYIMRDSLNAKSVIFIILFIIVLLRDKYQKNKDESPLYKFFLLYMVLFIVTVFVPIFDRFTFYFSIYFVIVLSNKAITFANTTRLNYYALLIMIVVMNTHTMIMNKYVYLPYTNYVSYMFKEKPSFTYRSSYNYKYSPAINRK